MNKDSLPVLPRPFPVKREHVGRSVRLAPLSALHVPDLWQAMQGAEHTWRHLRYGPFSDIDALRDNLLELEARALQPFWAVIDSRDGLAKGWLSLCDVYPSDAAIEIGSIWFSPALQRTRASTEAVFLLMQHVFDELLYQRLVWRCLEGNEPSRLAAERYGFSYEGRWRDGFVIKGVQRNVLWHSMLAPEWPRHATALRRWLADSNFDEQGRALERLQTIRKSTEPQDGHS
ncbi:GNAT family protein [Herbaspirillum lusitanum]|uniref:GNAT family protein n=1 Tax=Herbaspirillum lusitanum TaxID=213312 RepID=A0ABW9A8J7_9BURK